VFKRFFGKKNDGFYLQLEDEDATSKPDPKAKVEAKPEPVATPASSAVAADAAATADPAKVSPIVAAAAAAVAKANQKAAKAEKKSAKKDPKVVAAPAAVVAPVVTAPAITNFATDYLIKPSSSSSRRLPGANMRGFLDLARQVDKPKAFKASASERKAD
jgi:hypothetical protein